MRSKWMLAALGLTVTIGCGGGSPPPPAEEPAEAPATPAPPKEEPWASQAINREEKSHG